ncbi:LapA family protein [Tepidibacillus fermentans]|uniref:Putative integral membrane protein n=1 Tax=Tepidibacillus fermentans TaxID=1281767 RepID=A0A4R3KKR9_9BACI|nr:LapA family protein [Tepidibacillus fermentans]TCS84483.1 putative integral membrane protein [Tepidibacillus fermentans]
MQTRVIIFLIFTFIVVIFSVMNIQPVVIDFYFAKANVPLILVIIFSIFIGALLMYILSSMKYLKTTRKVKMLEKENDRLQQELQETKKQMEVETPQNQPSLD